MLTPLFPARKASLDRQVLLGRRVPPARTPRCLGPQVRSGPLGRSVLRPLCLDRQDRRVLRVPPVQLDPLAPKVFLVCRTFLVRSARLVRRVIQGPLAHRVQHPPCLVPPVLLVLLAPPVQQDPHQRCLVLRE